MISSIAAIAIIGVLPLNEIPSSPSRISGVDSMMMKKMANRGASLPARATIGLPPAQASQARMLRWLNSEPTAYPAASAITTCRTIGNSVRSRNCA